MRLAFALAAAGQLDSDTYSTTGMSDGTSAFGGTCDAGNFARGIATGGVARRRSRCL